MVEDVFKTKFTKMCTICVYSYITLPTFSLPRRSSDDKYKENYRGLFFKHRQNNTWLYNSLIFMILSPINLFYKFHQFQVSLKLHNDKYSFLI